MSNLHPATFSVEHAVKLQKSWNVGKSNFELWMPLEQASAVAHPPVVPIPETMLAARAELSKTPLMMKSGPILTIRMSPV